MSKEQRSIFTLAKELGTHHLKKIRPFVTCLLLEGWTCLNTEFMKPLGLTNAVCLTLFLRTQKRLCHRAESRLGRYKNPLRTETRDWIVTFMNFVCTYCIQRYNKLHYVLSQHKCRSSVDAFPYEGALTILDRRLH